MKESIQYEKGQTGSSPEKAVLGSDRKEVTTPPKIHFTKSSLASSPSDSDKDMLRRSPRAHGDNRRSSFSSGTMRGSGMEVSDEFEMNSGHLDVGSYNHDSNIPNAFSIPQSPSSKTKLLPPTTPKSRHNEVFLSPSSPKLKSPGVYKEHDKPIREISNTLKTRLNYALVKLQNGWTEKTFSELEKGLPNEKKNLHTSDTIKLETQRRLSVYNNIYANDDSDNDGNSRGDHNIAKFSIESHKNSKIENKDLIKGPRSNSAHTAFLKAISSPKKSNNDTFRDPVSPLKWNQKANSPMKETSPVPEDEAIETLMSLSSPKKSHSGTFDHYDSNKKTALSDRELVGEKTYSALKPPSLSNGSNYASRDNKTQTQTDTGNDSTDIEMEYDDVQTDIEDPETSVDT